MGLAVGSVMSRPLAGRRGPARFWLVLAEAAAQRLDEIDGPTGHGKTLHGLRRQAGLLGPQVRQQGLLIAVAETRRREARGLAVENVRGEPEQLGRRRQVRYLAEIVPRMAHLIGIVQRGADQALVIRLAPSPARAWTTPRAPAPPGLCCASPRGSPQRRPARPDRWG